jgi:hypothetical protein
LLVAAERHVRECDACAGHDTAVRRSLMLARNLPPIELSADFADRLARRLDDVRAGRCEVPHDEVPYDWAPTARSCSAPPSAAPRRGASPPSPPGCSR